MKKKQLGRNMNIRVVDMEKNWERNTDEEFGIEGRP